MQVHGWLAAARSARRRSPTQLQPGIADAHHRSQTLVLQKLHCRSSKHSTLEGHGVCEAIAK